MAYTTLFHAPKQLPKVAAREDPRERGMPATRDPSVASPSQERVNMDLLHKIFVGRFADFLIVRSKLLGGHKIHLVVVVVVMQQSP